MGLWATEPAEHFATYTEVMTGRHAAPRPPLLERIKTWLKRVLHA